MELKDGGLTFFYSSGEIFCDGQIRESVYIDTARFYDVTGKCIKNIIYYGNGNNKIYYPLEGKYYDYYKTGEIQTEGFVVNHKFEGLKKLYSKNGNISYQANMINGSGWSFYLANGKQYGTYKEWYENGKLLEISNWNNSLQHGARVTFFENGVIKLKDFWTFGKRNWLFRDYYSNGNLQTSRIFKNGREEGQTQSYHENGKLQIEFSYINGNREGGYIQYHENGKLSCVGQFENDKEVGEWLWYDEKGKLFQKDTYKEGQIIAIKNNQTKVADY